MKNEPILQFQVASDIHITCDKDHIHNRHFSLLLDDVNRVCPQSRGIFVAGDLTDGGREEQYGEFFRIYGKSNCRPEIIAVAGNHDIASDYEENIKRFKENMKTAASYYSVSIADTGFIFLCGEEAGLRAVLSEKQLTFLENELNKHPISFVFIHQGVYNTVAGTLEGQGWDGVICGERLLDALKRHKNVFLFSGHSHWQLGSEGGVKRLYEGVYAFNTSSVAYLWNDGCDPRGPGIEGSECLYVNLYKSRIEVKGRDLVKGEWIDCAAFETDIL